MDAASANYTVWRSFRFPPHPGDRQLLYIFLDATTCRHCACDFAFDELLRDLTRPARAVLRFVVICMHEHDVDGLCGGITGDISRRGSGFDQRLFPRRNARGDE